MPGVEGRIDARLPCYDKRLGINALAARGGLAATI
jgi:hypothetical protein